MNLFYRSTFPLFVTIALLGVFLAGCLDAPSDPDDLQPVESVSIKIKQDKGDYSTVLKVHPSDSATILATVEPEKLQKDLSFKWYYTFEGKDSLLQKGEQFTFYPSRSESTIPNKLIVSDKEGNKQTYEFSVIINTAPVLSDSTIPVNGDTLYGTKESAFLFEWYSLDMDLANGDTLFHILEIDSTQYDVGTLMQVKQSGFKAGKHSFRIIVRDLYGDSDTIAYKSFYVVDTLEAK
ncbi:hypothetical protein [Fibrobacter sp.]|uniref:hypothetical protein n=1 Tax=Fibrobacter sp. TaxID=35828 RepID=UPI003865EE18